MKKNNTLSGILLLFLLLSGSICIWLLPEKGFSDLENRKLTTYPKFHIQSYLDSSYQKQMESALHDQFPNRDVWTALHSDLLLYSGASKIKDVYIGSDDMLMQEFQPQNDRTTLSKQLNTFSKTYKDIPISMMLVPNKIDIYSNKTSIDPSMPNQRTYYEQFIKQLDKNINIVDVWEQLKAQKDNNIFFKSDHHWTVEGAKIAAETYLNKKISRYDRYDAISKFYGSLSKKIAYTRSYDSLELYLPKTPDCYTVENLETKAIVTSLYDKEKLQSNDPYRVFFGGNAPILRISSAVEHKERLLICKDSFANAFIPFLIPYYQEIVVIDPRYYYGDIDKVIKDEQITNILFLYNMNTFFSDDSLSSLL